MQIEVRPGATGAFAPALALERKGAFVAQELTEVVEQSLAKPKRLM